MSASRRLQGKSIDDVARLVCRHDFRRLDSKRQERDERERLYLGPVQRDLARVRVGQLYLEPSAGCLLGDSRHQRATREGDKEGGESPP